jgi:hypothetical protein
MKKRHKKRRVNPTYLTYSQQFALSQITSLKSPTYLTYSQQFALSQITSLKSPLTPDSRSQQFDAFQD